MLLEFAEKLSPLPARYHAERDAGMGRVVECQTPVFLWVTLEDGRVRIDADVAPEAPTVKGFVSLLVDIYSGATPDEALAVESNVVERFGLADPRRWAWCGCADCRRSAHHIRKKIAAAA